VSQTAEPDVMPRHTRFVQTGARVVQGGTIRHPAGSPWLLVSENRLHASPPETGP